MTVLRELHLEPQTGAGSDREARPAARDHRSRGRAGLGPRLVLADDPQRVAVVRTDDRLREHHLPDRRAHVLYSNRSRPMWTIVEDTVGRHDFLLTPCSPETFTILYKTTGHHPSCFENLARSLEPFGIAPDAIPTTLNIFMNVDVLPSGELRILPPRSRAGDRLVLRAEMDLDRRRDGLFGRALEQRPLQADRRPAPCGSRCCAERARPLPAAPRGVPAARASESRRAAGCGRDTERRRGTRARRPPARSATARSASHSGREQRRPRGKDAAPACRAASRLRRPARPRRRRRRARASGR